MKKKQLFLAATAILLASCADNSYLGDQAAIAPGSGVITFGSSSPAVTRTEVYGSTAAAKLEYKFKVFGMKTVGTSDQRVFATNTTGVAPYDVWFVDGSSNSTASNSSNWEYVGSNGSTYGTTGYTVKLGADQTIKYWDYSATAYNFQAWSDINATTSKVDVSAIDKNTMTITGNPTQLANFYLSDLQTGAPASFASKVVQFTFRRAATKVRLGIYETVPGYVVKNVTFSYTDGTVKKSPADPTSAAEKAYAYLDGKFVGTSSSSETFEVSYDATTNRALLAPTNTTTSNTTYFNFGEFSRGAIGEFSTDPTWAYTTSATDPYTSVLPNTTASNISDMTLKVDYELYNDKSEETIKITGATAVVPAAYMTWKPNYAYTYLFKITDDKLTPITLDAVVIDDGEGKQETITTVSVSDPSITTYQNGSDVTVTNEYTAGKPIYVVVTGETLTDTNAKLYTATATDGYSGGITEASVANAFANGKPEFDGGTILAAETPLDGYYTKDGTTYTACAAGTKANGTTTYYKPTGVLSLTDTSDKTITVTPVASTATDKLTAFSLIPAADSPTGADLALAGAQFTPIAPVSPATINYYVFQYVKVAPVAAQPAVYYTDETAATHNAGLTGALSTSDVVYSFTSYGKKDGVDEADTDTQHGTGMVKYVSADGTYTTVEVISNTPVDANATDFVGQQFKVKATTLTENTYYQLYSTEGVPYPIYVTVAASTPNAYNATLSGAVTAGDIETAAVPAVEGEYVYKVIKVQ